MTYLFVDTNVLLHYRRLEEINWLSLSKSDEVVIVLCPAVIRELDEHKVSHPQNKFRKRAQEIIASLHSRLWWQFKKRIPSKNVSTSNSGFNALNNSSA
ncbi:MAG: PIN domain-containing protein [Verrucomicrobiia bacterium]